jgi:hypothetical protein
VFEEVEMSKCTLHCFVLYGLNHNHNYNHPFELSIRNRLYSLSFHKPQPYLQAYLHTTTVPGCITPSTRSHLVRDRSEICPRTGPGLLVRSLVLENPSRTGPDRTAETLAGGTEELRECALALLHNLLKLSNVEEGNTYGTNNSSMHGADETEMVD